MNPFFSIIVPVYQAEKTLERCVRSVLDQSFQDYEVILVDDGSRDKSGGMCDAFAKEDARIRVAHQENAGVSAARNAGIELAAGVYLLFLDSDDYLLGGALEAYRQASEGGAADVVIGRLSVMENGRESRRIGFDTEIAEGREIWERICRDSAPFGYAGGKMIRREIVRQGGFRFNPGMRSQEDLDFFLSAYGACERFHIIPQCVYAYDYAPSARAAQTWDFISNQMKLLSTAKERVQLSSAAEACVQRRILTLLYTGLYAATENGTYEETVGRMRKVAGLTEFLRDVPADKEHRLVARAFAAGQYGRISKYFTVRNRIRDIYRFLRKH